MSKALDWTTLCYTYFLLKMTSKYRIPPDLSGQAFSVGAPASKASIIHWRYIRSGQPHNTKVKRAIQISARYLPILRYLCTV